MKFSEVIKQIRDEHHLSQKEFADKIGVGQTIVSYWEKDDRLPSYENLRMICKTFDITPSEVLFLDSEQSVAKVPKYQIEHYSDSEKRLINLYRQIDASGQQLIEDTAKTLARKQVKLVPIRAVARTADNRPSYQEFWVTEEEAEELKARFDKAPKLDPDKFD